jgi:hypothetical protein
MASITECGPRLYAGQLIDSRPGEVVSWLKYEQC